jgi:hypothetical protein
MLRAVGHTGLLPYRQRVVYLRPIVLVGIKDSAGWVVVIVVTQDAGGIPVGVVILI